jgi:DNA adenine methylase
MSSFKPFSPLRYPGGKACLAFFLESILLENNINSATYYEFYAGGAGAALSLLLNGSVNNIVLNDADIHIYSFWYSILNRTDEFVTLISDCNIDLASWYRQRDVYENPTSHSLLEIGFSTFFLNRCNRSGILSKAGPIGGFNQNGNYLLDARFKKKSLIARIEAIAVQREHIQIYNNDALQLIENLIDELRLPNSILYLDPPYYNKGKSLYLNYYDHEDHEQLRDTLNKYRTCNWLVSYDNVEQIQRLYQDFNQHVININYSLQSKKKMSEIFIFSDNIYLPLQNAV